MEVSSSQIRTYGNAWGRQIRTQNKQVPEGTNRQPSSRIRGSAFLNFISCFSPVVGFMTVTISFRPILTLAGLWTARPPLHPDDGLAAPATAGWRNGQPVARRDEVLLAGAAWSGCGSALGPGLDGLGCPWGWDVRGTKLGVEGHFSDSAIHRLQHLVVQTRGFAFEFDLGVPLTERSERDGFSKHVHLVQVVLPRIVKHLQQHRALELIHFKRLKTPKETIQPRLGIVANLRAIFIVQRQAIF